MKNLITLVKMQLKEKLNLKGLENEKISAFKLLSSIVFALTKFAVVTGIFSVLLILINMIGLFSLVNRTPTSVMSIIFYVMLIASTFSCTLGLTKAMYFSNDNAILLTLPCKPIQVYLSKLIIFFAFELKRNFSFMVPIFVAYYIIHGYPIGAYLWLLICFVFISLFTVALASILSLPAMWISSLFRQHRSLQITTLVLIVSAAVVALFYAISLIPEHLDLRADWPVITMNIQYGLIDYTNDFKILYDLTLIFLGRVYDVVQVAFPIGETALGFASILGATAALFALGFVTVLPLFYKMASSPFEYLKKAVKPKQNRVVNSKLTTAITEFMASVKNSARLFNNVGVMVSVPILIYLLNKIFFAMNTSSMGNNLVIMFNVLIILLIVLNNNASAASIYSRDGRSAYLIKTQPTEPAILLFSKLMPDAIFSMLSLVATFVILVISAKLGVLNSLVLMLGIMCIYFAHLMYCAELDIINPQYEIYATVGSSDNNPNETNATLSAFLISFLTAGIVMLLLLDGSFAVDAITITDKLSIDMVFVKVFLVALALAIYRTYMYFSKIKLYYKER